MHSHFALFNTIMLNVWYTHYGLAYCSDTTMMQFQPLMKNVPKNIADEIIKKRNIQLKDEDVDNISKALF